jgi:hypothetical protein
MNLKQLYQKLAVLPALIVFTYLCLFLETIKYPGFVGNHFIIDVKVYFTVVIFLILFSDTRLKIVTFVLRVNRLFLLPLFLVYLGFSLLEGAHYANYVLANFRFHLDSLNLVVLFSLSIFLADRFKNIIPMVKGKLSVVYILLVLLVVNFMIGNAAYISDMAFSRDSYILFHLGSSYDDRMYYQWRIFYQYMLFVKNNTPSDAIIVIPPEQGAWLMGTGEPNFVRAFLYPRKIIQGTLTDLDTKSFGPNTFVLIAWGQEECKPDPGCHGWPRQDIKTSKIIYKDPNSDNVIETKENSVYKLSDDKYVYGIIELR